MPQRASTVTAVPSPTEATSAATISANNTVIRLIPALSFLIGGGGKEEPAP